MFFVCVLCGLFLLVFVFCVVFAFGSLCFGSCSLERDKVIGLCIGPLPVDFCGPTAWPLRELINYSHMQHDWKHVERPGESHTALDGKKTCSYPQKSSRMRGFNWDSPRQRHRFCYVNQNKEIEKNIRKMFKQIQNNKKNKIPTDLTCTDCVHEIRRIFFLQMLQREQ